MSRNSAAAVIIFHALSPESINSPKSSSDIEITYLHHNVSSAISDESGFAGKQPSVQETVTMTITPMGEALRKAVERLTSQIFLFLIAYMILVIFLTLWTKTISLEVRMLSIILPVAGLMVYTYLERQKIRAYAQDLDVKVSATIATGEATVAGIRGSSPDRLRAVDVNAKYVGGRATVVGVDNSQGDAGAQPDAAYLLQLFEQLDAKGRGELISAANHMVAKLHR